MRPPAPNCGLSAPDAAGAGRSGAARASASPASHTFPGPGVSFLVALLLTLSPRGPHWFGEARGVRGLAGSVLGNAGPERAGSDLQLTSRRLGAPTLGLLLIYLHKGCLWRGYYLGGAGGKPTGTGRMRFGVLGAPERESLPGSAPPDSLCSTWL